MEENITTVLYTLNTLQHQIEDEKIKLSKEMSRIANKEFRGKHIKWSFPYIREGGSLESIRVMEIKAVFFDKEVEELNIVGPSFEICKRNDEIISADITTRGTNGIDVYYQHKIKEIDFGFISEEEYKSVKNAALEYVKNTK